MGLPEYDNRPGPGEALYSDNSSSEWDDIKFPLRILGIAALFIAGIAGVLFGVFN